MVFSLLSPNSAHNIRAAFRELPGLVSVSNGRAKEIEPTGQVGSTQSVLSDIAL